MLSILGINHHIDIAALSIAAFCLARRAVREEEEE